MMKTSVKYYIVFISVLFTISIFPQKYIPPKLPFPSKNILSTKNDPAIIANPAVQGGAFFFVNNPNNNNDNFIKMDSIITSSVQGERSRHLFTYNENNKMSEWLMLDSAISGWENSLKDDYSYDMNNYLITDISLGWNTTEWDSLDRINYSYLQGRIAQSVFQSFDNNIWINSSRSNYNYDSSGNVKTELIENWQNNSWQNFFLISYFYSNQDLRDSILSQNWDGNQWQNLYLTTYYYDNSGLDVDSMLVQNWTGSDWVNFIRRDIVNDVNHNQIEITEQNWETNSWQNSIRFFYSYNETNYITYARCEIWTNNQWSAGDDVIFFKNPDGFTAGFITNKVWAYYTNVTEAVGGQNSQPLHFILYQNYPNPFNPTTKICWQSPVGSWQTLKVYDILGREVATLVNEYKPAGDYTVTFNALNLPSGIYFYTLTAGYFNQIKKMIIMK